MCIVLANSKSTNLNGRITATTLVVMYPTIDTIPYSFRLRVVSNFVIQQAEISGSLLMLFIDEQICYRHHVVQIVLCILKKKAVEIIIYTAEWQQNCVCRQLSELHIFDIHQKVKLEIDIIWL